MKKIAILILLVLLMSATLFSANLIVDPSFEAGSSAWAMTNAELKGDDVMHGSLACATTPGAEGAVSQEINVVVGVSYVLLAWIKMGEWGESGWLEVKYSDDDKISQEIRHAHWHMYAIPFVAQHDKVTALWRMGPNSKGSHCDMFALAEYEELLVDGSLEAGGTDLFRWNMWSWGAIFSDWEPRTGSMGMKANADGGGGFGFYPDIFKPGEIIIAAAWIRTGENSLWYPGFRDHDGWTNLGWWAVRKAEHVSEINIELSDVGWHQYVIPYKIPSEGFNPEVLWWQQSGEEDSYLDDMLLFRSPYADDEIPWEMIIDDAENIWNVWADPNDPTWPITPAVSVKERPQNLPTSFALLQNHPNPFNPQTEITFILSKPADVTLAVYNICGREMVLLLDEFKGAGEHRVRFDASGLGSGIYFYQLKAGQERAVKKMICTR